MKKLAFSNVENLVYVAMSPSEFKILAKTAQGNVTDGAIVDVVWIKDMTTVFDGKKAQLEAVAAEAAKLATTISLAMQ